MASIKENPSAPRTISSEQIEELQGLLDVIAGTGAAMTAEIEALRRQLWTAKLERDALRQEREHSNTAPREIRPGDYIANPDGSRTIAESIEQLGGDPPMRYPRWKTTTAPKVEDAIDPDRDLFRPLTLQQEFYGGADITGITARRAKAQQELRAHLPRACFCDPHAACSACLDEAQDALDRESAEAATTERA
jgi:hypothetical protein